MKFGECLRTEIFHLNTLFSVYYDFCLVTAIKFLSGKNDLVVAGSSVSSATLPGSAILKSWLRSRTFHSEFLKLTHKLRYCRGAHLRLNFI